VRTLLISTGIGAAAIVAAGAALPVLRAGPSQHSDPTALSRYDFREEASAQWRLPNRLREISGLATSADGRLFAHNDERAIVYEIDYKEGRLTKAFALGDPIARGDFEGIAVVGDTVYLITSGGRLYETREAADEQRTRYNTYDTGVGGICEVEGLALEPTDRSLVLVCKTVDDDELKGSISIFRWSVDRHELTDDSPILIDRDLVTDQIPGKSFNPSGIERHPLLGSFFVVAARQEAIIEISPAGELLGIAELRGKRHRQVEGIAFSPAGDLLLSDEGSGRRARLTIYTASTH
jgi:uncharacterized protein YjiK